MDLPPLHQLRPTPTAVFPLRELPVDLARKVLDDVLASTPIDELCGRLYERCLLLQGSGNCSPTDPIWKMACRRLGLTPQAGFEPMGNPGSWQTTFRTFCSEVSRLAPSEKAAVQLCIRGHADLVSLQVRESLRQLWQYFGMPLLTVLQLLSFHGIFDPYIEDEDVAHLPYPQLVLLLEDRPSRGLRAMLGAIEAATPEGAAAVQRLLQVGVNVESRITPQTTLLHHAIEHHASGAVVRLLEFGADVTARDESGFTASEHARHEMLKLVYEYRLGEIFDETWFRERDARDNIWAALDGDGARHWWQMSFDDKWFVANRHMDAQQAAKHVAQLDHPSEVDLETAEQKAAEAAAAFAQYGL